MKRVGVAGGAQSGFLILALFLAPSAHGAWQTAQGVENVRTDPSELDLRSYQEELSRIAQACEDPKDIEQIRKSLPESWKVNYGGQVITVSTTEISESLRAAEKEPKRARELEQQLGAMRSQAEQLSNSSEGTSREAAEEKLGKILKEREFQASPGPTWLDVKRDRIYRWITLRLIKLISRLHIGARTGNTIAWTVLFAAIVALFYVVYMWLTRSTEELRFRADVEPNTSDARRWIEEAMAAADREDFREAVHCAYWASVAHLEDIRVLPRDRARTPRESLRLLDRHPNEQGILKAITRSFELIWYGYRPVSAEQWAGTKKELEKMGCLEASTAPTGPS